MSPPAAPRIRPPRRIAPPPPPPPPDTPRACIARALAALNEAGNAAGHAATCASMAEFADPLNGDAKYAAESAIEATELLSAAAMALAPLEADIARRPELWRRKFPDAAAARAKKEASA